MTAQTIKTENLNIDRELCRRLDKAYFSKHPKRIVVDRWRVYQTELLNAIRPFTDDRTYEIMTRKGLYYLCGALERMRNDEGRHICERMHANMQTAHNQLKNWK